MKYGRILEFLLGALFIASAAAKALDIPAFALQVRFYGLLQEKETILTVARFVIAFEAALGTALLAGIRLYGLTFLITGITLLVFIRLVAFAWAFEGLEDCGCFGKFVKLTPGATIVKNIVLLGMTAGAWWGLRTKPPAIEGEAGPAPPIKAKPGMAGYATGAVGALVVVIAWMAGASATAPSPPAGTDSQSTGPFSRFKWEHEGERIDLGQGEWLVAMLSATCEHCQASVPALNEFSLTLEPPRVASIMMGAPDEMEKFRQLTQPLFPTLAVDTLEFLELIGKYPPRFYIVANGSPVRHLDMPEDAKDVSLDQLVELARGPVASMPESPQPPNDPSQSSLRNPVSGEDASASARSGPNPER